LTRDRKAGLGRVLFNPPHLDLLALVLIVLHLPGFLALHVSTGLIHILLVIGVVLLVFHFLARQRQNGLTLT
jgi:hypothetical protein